MPLSDRLVAEFKQLYEKKMGVNIIFEDAQKYAEDIVEVYSIFQKIYQKEILFKNLGYLKKFHMICIDVNNFKDVYEEYMVGKSFNEMESKGYSLEDLKNDKKKANEIADVVVEKNLKKKDDIEIFIALDTCLSFYPKDSKICFMLKDTFNPRKQRIKDVADLKSATKEGTLTDFAIFSNGLRQIQLKQYKGELKTDSFYDYVKEKIEGYGDRTLNNINLLFVIQGKRNNAGISEIDFHEINRRIMLLRLTFHGEILIIYNEENKFHVINQVYPELKSRRVKFTPQYLEGYL